MRFGRRVVLALVACLSLAAGCRQDNPVVEGPAPTANAATPVTSP